MQQQLELVVEAVLETLETEPIDWSAASAACLALGFECRETRFEGAAEFLGTASKLQNVDVLRAGLLVLRRQVAG